MSTLTEIEAAVELLPPGEKQELLRYLEQHVNEPAPGRHALPLVPATGQPITQQDVDDALEADFYRHNASAMQTGVAYHPRFW